VIVIIWIALKLS